MDESAEEGRRRAIEQYRKAIEDYKSPSELPSFAPTVHAALIRTPIIHRLRAASAVVLERLARGGGGSRWYYCPDEAHLVAVETRLRPGSLVSFYFDDRIQSGLYSSDIKAKVLTIPAKSGPLIGPLNNDGIEIDMIVDVDPGELEEYNSVLLSAKRVFYGEFPGSDSDEFNSITLTLPDADGVTRKHPY